MGCESRAACILEPGTRSTSSSPCVALLSSLSSSLTKLLPRQDSSRNLCDPISPGSRPSYGKKLRPMSTTSQSDPGGPPAIDARSHQGRPIRENSGTRGTYRPTPLCLPLPMPASELQVPGRPQGPGHVGLGPRTKTLSSAGPSKPSLSRGNPCHAKRHSAGQVS